MLQGALYILAGASFFAGAQRLHADIKRRAQLTVTLYTGLLILLAACSAMTAASLSPNAPGETTTLSMISATLLWSLLPWATACLISIRAGLTTDLLSAGWITALIGQLSYPQPDSAYWNGVSWLMLLTLAHSALITLWHRWPACKPVVGRYLVGLSLLTLAALAGLALEIPLFPFGFLLFLLLTANLSFLRVTPGMVPVLEHIPARPMNLALDRRAGARQPAAVNQPPAEASGRRRPSSTRPEPIAESRSSVGLEERKTTAQISVNDSQRGPLTTLADDLMDITVYASMALNRIRKDEPDPRHLKPLLRRIRSRAIKSHRDANRLSRPREDVNYRDLERFD